MIRRRRDAEPTFLQRDAASPHTRFAPCMHMLDAARCTWPRTHRIECLEIYGHALCYVAGSHGGPLKRRRHRCRRLCQVQLPATRGMTRAHAWMQPHRLHAIIRTKCRFSLTSRIRQILEHNMPPSEQSLHGSESDALCSYIVIVVDGSKRTCMSRGWQSSWLRFKWLFCGACTGPLAKSASHTVRGT